MRSTVQFQQGLFVLCHQNWGIWFICGEVEGTPFHLNYVGSSCYWAPGCLLSAAQKLRVRRFFNKNVRDTDIAKLAWATNLDGLSPSLSVNRRVATFHRQWCRQHSPGAGVFGLDVPVGHETRARSLGAFEQEDFWVIGCDMDLTSILDWLSPEDLEEYEVNRVLP